MSEPIEKRILGELMAGWSPSMSRVALKDCLEAHDLIVSQRARISELRAENALLETAQHEWREEADRATAEIFRLEALVESLQRQLVDQAVKVAKPLPRIAAQFERR
jgi:hypothetical protein